MKALVVGILLLVIGQPSVWAGDEAYSPKHKAKSAKLSQQQLKGRKLSGQPLRSSTRSAQIALQGKKLNSQQPLKTTSQIKSQTKLSSSPLKGYPLKSSTREAQLALRGKKVKSYKGQGLKTTGGE